MSENLLQTVAVAVEEAILLPLEQQPGALNQVRELLESELHEVRSVQQLETLENGVSQ